MQDTQILRDAKLKFTAAQKKIVNRLLAGDSIIKVKRPYGEDLMWVTKAGDIELTNSAASDRLYKTLCYVHIAVNKVDPTIKLKDFYSKNN